MFILIYSCSNAFITMEDNYESLITKFCCTCLSEDRKLFKLCKITEGVNNLYWLLSYDSESFMEGFHKDSSNLFICWECRAVLSRIHRFRKQACCAQRMLTKITEGHTNNAVKVFSCLTISLKESYDYTFTHSAKESSLKDNFIDCGPVTELNTDYDIDDVPLSEFLINSCMFDIKLSEKSIDCNYIYTNKLNKQKKRLVRKGQDSNSSKKNVSKRKGYTTININEKEMVESRVKRKMEKLFVDSPHKCDSCIEVFKEVADLERHKLDMHTQKDGLISCDICEMYIKERSLLLHRNKHYLMHKCGLCDFYEFNVTKMSDHLNSVHGLKRLFTMDKGKASKPNLQRRKVIKDKKNAQGFSCMECHKIFENNKLRWKHIQKCHKEGFECASCGKRFPFRNDLSRHELTHSTRERVSCEHCGKSVRSDLLKVHALIHSVRERMSCALCERTFASKASYFHHLKYTRAHAVNDVLKYKCSVCDKGYKSKGELRDHINYNHMGKTQHKCPICGKALATRRCVTRHVKRAHEGIKESERDKVCQQCGKAFRNKKGLREHEFIHTGERPLSCEICGCTFRQNATLYTHKKRVHKIHSLRKNVQLMEGEVTC